MLAAIHQPSFLPWLGFFDKIIRSDVFVILDNVQFPKTGGYWANRVKLIISGEPKWITVPINRTYNGTKLINEIEIDNSKKWNEKLLKTIEVNYKKAAYFSEIFPIVTELLNNEDTNLAKFNYRIIFSFCSLLGINTSKIVLGSSLNCVGNATELLISILKEINATEYMYGGGAHKYQQDHMFAENNIKLSSQSFEHPVYAQFNTPEFVPGLSIIDALCNCGVESTRALLKL